MTISESQFNRIVLTAVALGFLALIVAVTTLTWGIRRSQELSDWVTHTLGVELSIADLRSQTARVIASHRGYLLQPEDRFLKMVEEGSAGIAETIDHIAGLTADNPRQVAAIGTLRPLSARWLDAVRGSIEEVRSKGLDAARAEFLAGGSADVLDDLRTVFQAMIGEEQRLLAERRAEEAASIRTAYLILALSGMLLLVVAAATAWIIRRNLRDVKRSRDRLGDLNDNLEAAVDMRAADLQRANEEIQRFAYIVSHDLRSPLVNVMGFTSELDAATKPLSDLIERVEKEAPALLTEDARLAVREDLPEAVGFIRSSTQKMDRLINAILRLSREGRRVITPETLDVSEMLEGIVGSLQHRLTEIGAEVRVEKPLPALVSDRVAIEQILSNLVENAVKYLKPGEPGRIVVRARPELARIVYEVEDNGRGIDPKDHERIFDLFRRSGAQDQPGEGIGLAHVRALAYRLGGIVDCRSALGAGATFRLSMPRRFEAMPASSKR